MNPTTPDHLLTRLQWRYATKLFDPEKNIAPALWRQVEESLILTPSSFGLQPWHFIVVTRPETKEKLRAQSWNQAQVTDCSHFLILAAKTKMEESDVGHWVNAVAENTDTEPATLAGYRGVMVKFLAGMDAQAKEQWAKNQSYIALGQIMTTAALLHIDACPMEGFDHLGYNNTLGLAEKGLTATVACALGYRSEEDKYAHTPKTRFPAGKLITRIE